MNKIIRRYAKRITPRAYYFQAIIEVAYPYWPRLLTVGAMHQRGSHVARDSLVSVMYSTKLKSTTSSVIPQRTDRHEILGQKPCDFQRLS